MILASQKCFFDKQGLGYKPSKNKKYFKNYFVKEASSFSSSTIYNLCGRGSHISDFFPLRKSPHVFQNSKLFWIPNGRKSNPLGPKKIWVPKVTKFILQESMQKGGYAYLGKNALIIFVMVSLLKLNFQQHFIILLTLGIIFVNNITFGITCLNDHIC